MIKMRKGFTLLELITVVIIIGILALIAVPQFFKVAERARSAEGIAVAGNLRDAQLRYSSEFGTTTDDMGNLDINITAIKFFTPVLSVATPANGSNGTIVTMTRNNVSNPGYGSYVFTVNYAGNISCSGGINEPCKMFGM